MATTDLGERPAPSIRDALAEDAAPICAIYNQGIEDRVATLETELRTPEERGQGSAKSASTGNRGCSAAAGSTS